MKLYVWLETKEHKQLSNLPDGVVPLRDAYFVGAYDAHLFAVEPFLPRPTDVTKLTENLEPSDALDATERIKAVAEKVDELQLYAATLPEGSSWAGWAVKHRHLQLGWRLNRGLGEDEEREYELAMLESMKVHRANPS